MTGRLVTAGLLTADTLASLNAAQERRSDFILVPESSAGSTPATARSIGGAPLPQVWEDLFAASRAAQSSDYLDGLACRRPPISHAAQEARLAAAEAAAATGAAASEAEPAAAQGDGSPAAPAEAAAAAAGAADDDPTLGISQDTIFERYLSPEALVVHHRLGKEQARRLYQALQVYSLGFHQTMLEVTRHAAHRGLLHLALWRGFAFLWDAALQAVFPAETVQQGRERQAALLAGEQLMGQLAEERARSAALELENAALRQQTEGAVVQLLSVQADAEVARQSVAGLQRQLKAAAAERAAAAAQAEAGRRELLQAQERLAALAGPQTDLYTRAQQLEAALKEKQGQLSTAAKQAAAALAAKEEAQQAARGERLKREAAEARAQQLQEDLNAATLRLRAADNAAAAREKQAAAEAAAEAAARAEDTARLGTERAGWERHAAAAEAEAVRLRSALAAAEERAVVQQRRSEELLASLAAALAQRGVAG